LGNNRAVKIAAGTWEVISGEELLTIFKRHPHQLPQPEPQRGGDPARIFDYVRIADEYRLLALVTLITCFLSRINHPALLFLGSQGSGKSLAQSFWKMVLDPSEIMLSLMPRKIEDLPLLLSRNYVTNLDNIVANLAGDVLDIFLRR